MKIGEKIRRLRNTKEMTQEELANRCELTKGFISQIERDLTSPSLATLIDIMECLGTNLKDFFNEAEEEKIVFRKDDFFIQENQELKNTVTWIVPSSQKNEMEPILLELEPSGSSQVYNPHEGEKFGYVLTGSVNVYVGKKRFKVKKGECFYYKTNATNYITNEGKGAARVIWISTPPYF